MAIDLDALRARIADLGRMADYLAAEYQTNFHYDFRDYGESVEDVDDVIASMDEARSQIAGIMQQTEDVVAEANRLYDAADNLLLEAGNITDLSAEADDLDEELENLARRRQVLQDGGEKGVPRSRLKKKSNQKAVTMADEFRARLQEQLAALDEMIAAAQQARENAQAAVDGDTSDEPDDDMVPQFRAQMERDVATLEAALGRVNRSKSAPRLAAKSAGAHGLYR